MPSNFIVVLRSHHSALPLSAAHGLTFFIVNPAAVIITVLAFLKVISANGVL